jgi:alpha-mannosidase
MPYFKLHKKMELDALVERIKEAVYTPTAKLDVTAYVTREPLPYAERQKGEPLTLTPGQKWGNLFDCAWFHFKGVVPAQARGQSVVLLIDVNGEACIFDQAGCPIQGLTNVNSEFDLSLGKPGKRVVSLTSSAAGGETVDIWADAGCNDLFGRLQESGTLKQADIAICHPNLHALQYDFEVLHELMQQLPEKSARHERIWAVLTRAALVLQHLSDDEATIARKILAPELAKCAGDPSLQISAIGHAHIDLAWLWPLRETIRKGARTFSTALQFMERYPDYIFGASQAQLYLWMKERYPDLYAKVKQRVAEGRWEVQGGMWVEADTNVSGGEALVRQFLYGKRFFRQEFGVEVTNLWLPDVFGYSGALPQIMKKSGVDYFMTQKLSWSQVNQHPHHSFWWKGIDGTRVLTHMAPEGTYNSSAAPRAIAKAEQEYLDKSVSEHCLVIFGIGDGGGGPGEEHLERLCREKDLAGLSPVVQEPATCFFDKLLREADGFQTWAGELYLERHQGTYTTQARNKRFNRKLELALRELEMAASRALWQIGQAYPAEQLLDTWREMLLYQFHDILPGSSITRVYDESRARYAALLGQVQALTASADRSLYAQVNTQTAGKPLIVSNSLSWPRHEWVQWQGQWLEVTAPALGYATIDAASAQASYAAPQATDHSLENEHLAVSFDADGAIRSIIDKSSGREVLSAGSQANKLALYRDLGDAWDFQMHYDEQPVEFFSLQSAQVQVDGPRASIKQTYTYGASTLTQEIVLLAGSHRLDFITHVDWHETDKMLRTSFPVNVLATEATCDIQFGNIRRPARRNTSWDMAQFEVCAHKWVDLSERAFGVALLNDCKYGHKVRDNVLDLNLLRSPKYPDPQADQGEHDFTYSLLPHTGDYVAGEVIQRAYELNVPLRFIATDSHPGALPAQASLLQVDQPNVIVEAVKKAEDGDDLIVRLYESTGATTSATVRISLPVKAAALVNLLEEDATPISMHDGSVALTFTPYEIQTLRLSRS